MRVNVNSAPLDETWRRRCMMDPLTSSICLSEQVKGPKRLLNLASVGLSGAQESGARAAALRSVKLCCKVMEGISGSDHLGWQPAWR